MENVILFTQPTCPQCRTIHMILDNLHFNYDECQDLEKMKEIGINHTPALSVDGQIFYGNDIVKYAKGVK